MNRMANTVELLQQFASFFPHEIREISLYGLNEKGYLLRAKPEFPSSMHYLPWPKEVPGPVIFQQYLKDITPPSMQDGVREFHETYGAVVGDAPRALPEERKELRVKLIEEELQELREALAKDDAVETYDAAIDILYVTLGLLVECGMDAGPGFDEVQRSNMSKLGADGQPIISRGMDLDNFPEGKVLKGPNYFKPDLRRVLNEQGGAF